MLQQQQLTALQAKAGACSAHVATWTSLSQLQESDTASVWTACMCVCVCNFTSLAHTCQRLCSLSLKGRFQQVQAPAALVSERSVPDFCSQSRLQRWQSETILDVFLQSAICCDLGAEFRGNVIPRPDSALKGSLSLSLPYQPSATDESRYLHCL